MWQRLSPLASADEMRSLRRLFIANRGEIAARIARTARSRDLPCIVALAAEDEALVPQYGVDGVAPLPGSGAHAYADGAALVEAALA